MKIKTNDGVAFTIEPNFPYFNNKENEKEKNFLVCKSLLLARKRADQLYRDFLKLAIR